MNDNIKFALRDYFKRLRGYSKSHDWGCFFNIQEDLFGYLRGIYHAGVIDDVCYDKLFDIANHMTKTFGE